MKTQVYKIPVRLSADPRKVIIRPSHYPGKDRVRRIFDRVSNLTHYEAERVFRKMNKNFRHRHKNIESHYLDHYHYFSHHYDRLPELSRVKKLLLGASLTKEYSIHSSALFNPSMVPHPDQSGLSPGEKRFLLSLRSTGEGHISSVVFRSGIVDKKGKLTLEEDSSPYSITGNVLEQNGSEYTVKFPEDSLLSERVLFPVTKKEKNGIEDVRLVMFGNEERPKYYGTYTGWNGKEISPRMLETEDFLKFTIHSLKGKAVKDKGMALFPEKINGKYAIISRQGGESISIMFSDDLFHWSDNRLLMEPKYPFEISQIGNCGSPLKTRKGWLLLTHAVGPMRHYTISAALLDGDDPSVVISRLDRPLIWADENEREGYVPNVVYSCGGMIHKGKLFIPYAMSDSFSGFARVEVDELLEELESLK